MFFFFFVKIFRNYQWVVCCCWCCQDVYNDDDNNEDNDSNDDGDDDGGDNNAPFVECLLKQFYWGAPFDCLTPISLFAVIVPNTGSIKLRHKNNNRWQQFYNANEIVVRLGHFSIMVGIFRCSAAIAKARFHFHYLISTSIPQLPLVLWMIKGEGKYDQKN